MSANFRMFPWPYSSLLLALILYASASFVQLKDAGLVNSATSATCLIAVNGGAGCTAGMGGSGFSLNMQEAGGAMSKAGGYDLRSVIVKTWCGSAGLGKARFELVIVH